MIMKAGAAHDRCVLFIFIVVFGILLGVFRIES